VKDKFVNSIFILLAIIVFQIAGCSDTKINPGVEKSLSGSDMPSTESWNFEIMFYGENAKLSAILYADHALTYDEKRLKLLSKMKVDFYDSNQTVSTWLTADSGKVDDNIGMIYAIGNVITANDSGTVLKTEQLAWRKKDEKIITDKFVTVTSKKEDIQGYGFESDQHIRNWVIFKPVISTVINEDKKKK
jgi:LPS export ABC transporter protein LptC